MLEVKIEMGWGSINLFNPFILRAIIIFNKVKSVKNMRVQNYRVFLPTSTLRCFSVNLEKKKLNSKI